MPVVEAPPNLAIPHDAFYKAFKGNPQDYLDPSSPLSQPSAIDRILPATEAQEAVKPVISTIYFNSGHRAHLKKADQLQKEWDTSLRVQNRTDGIMLSYNPVLDRANFELLLERKASEEDIRNFNADLDQELATNLRERFHAPTSTIRYVVDGQGRIFSDNNSREEVDEIYLRGALYRIANHSPEPERELKTVEGGLKAKRKLAEEKTPLHTKAIIVSPPGISYKDNFVDIYEVDFDPQIGKKVIIMTRFASSLKEDEYRQVLTRLKPGYFEEQEGTFDEWCLQNPIFIDFEKDLKNPHEIFNQEFRMQEGVTSEEDIKTILRECASLRNYYKEVLQGKIFNPGEVAKAFRALLNKADAIKDQLINKGRAVLGQVASFVERVFGSAREELDWYGMQQVRESLVGCGVSGGSSLGGGVLEGVKNIFSKGIDLIKSIGSFLGFGSKDKDYCNKCPICKVEIKCIVRAGQSCPSCGTVKRCG